MVVYEAENYDVSFRAVTKDDKVRVYNNKNFLDVDSEINFDIDKDSLSSLEYFSASLIGGILHSIVANAKRKDILIEDLEGRVSFTLKNPLVLLGVNGYEESPKITNCTIKIYAYSDLDDEELEKFCLSSLSKCFMYETLKETIGIKVVVVAVL